MTRAMYTADFKAEPWWWEAAPPPTLSEVTLPARIDVLIVGSGYTGLHAALQTARGGRETMVVDAGAFGEGCSSRNGGQISTSVKPDYEALARRHGPEVAFAIRRSGMEALDFIDDFIAREGIECDFERVGRFHGAHAPPHYKKLGREITNQPKGLEVEAHLVPRTEQHREIGTDLYHGGVVYPAHALLHPGLYHAGLVQRALAAGVVLRADCRVERVERDADGFRVATTRGTLHARDVIVATNGYTGPTTPWQRRRVIPIGSYMIATEELDEALAAEISPTRRAMSDTRRMVFYYRLSPDARRMLFGGRVALRETDPRATAGRLHAEMCAIFPQLALTPISHAWMGFVAYTFDALPHIGKHDGLYYSLGYCGSGVSLASYFGMRVGLKVLGSPEGHTALDGVAFQTRPLYNGHPWFLGTAVGWYKLLDRLGV